jgi:hypothetical protein
VCPICIWLPYVPFGYHASISPRAVVTAYLSCIVRPIRARHYAAVARLVALYVLAGTTSKYYLPLSYAGAVMYPPRYPTRAILTLEPLAVLAGTIQPCTTVIDSLLALEVVGSPPGIHVPWGQLPYQYPIGGSCNCTGRPAVIPRL